MTAATPVDTILGKLEGVRRSGEGFTARCPAHADRENSLKVDAGDDGRALLRCFVGCEASAIVAALGLRLADLFPPKEATVGRNGHRPSTTNTTRYELRDEAGPVVAVHVRHDLSDGGKRVTWEQPDGSPGLGGVKVADLPLYGIHALGDAPEVILCEGEKATDALLALGIAAVGTVTGAAGCPSDASLRPLLVRRVALWPDADEPGETHMGAVADRLRALGQAPELVRRIGWPDAPPKGDAADFAESRGTVEEARKMIDAPPPALRAAPAARHAVHLSDVTPERLHWLSRGRLAAGKLAILDGDPGLGKSTLLCDLAARVSRGDPLPDGQSGPPRGVVLLSAEDGLADTIRPRLEAAGADLARVVALQTVPDPADPTGVGRLPAIPDDLAHVECLIGDVDAALLIVDPLMAYLGEGVNAHRDQDVRRALAPLAQLAERTGVAVVLVRHLNKAQSANALYRGGGSIGIVGAARVGLLLAKDPDDDDRRILAPTKGNLARPPSALAFRLATVPGSDVARVEWLGESAHSAASLLEAPAGDEERAERDQARGARAEARDWLADVLVGGPVPAATVQTAAKRDGVSPRTLDRAKADLGVVAARRGGLGGAGGWTWALPTPDADLRAPNPQEPGALSDFGALSGDPSPDFGPGAGNTAPSPKGANAQLRAPNPATFGALSEDEDFGPGGGKNPPPSPQNGLRAPRPPSVGGDGALSTPPPCLDCGGPLPDGRLYRCATCQPEAA